MKRSHNIATALALTGALAASGGEAQAKHGVDKYHTDQALAKIIKAKLRGNKPVSSFNGMLTRYLETPTGGANASLAPGEGANKSGGEAFQSNNTTYLMVTERPLIIDRVTGTNATDEDLAKSGRVAFAGVEYGGEGEIDDVNVYPFNRKTMRLTHEQLGTKSAFRSVVMLAPEDSVGPLAQEYPLHNSAK